MPDLGTAIILCIVALIVAAVVYLFALPQLIVSDIVMDFGSIYLIISFIFMWSSIYTGIIVASMIYLTFIKKK